MSFSQDNEYFLRHFGSAMKGLQNEERKMKFAKEFRSDIRSRIKVSYEKLGSSITDKYEFYNQLLTVFGEFEFEYLVLNIYFEREADELFKNMQPQFFQLPGLYSFIDPVIKQTTGTYNCSSIRTFLRTYFIDTIDLLESDWKMEDLSQNPFINRLADWLSHSVSSDTSPQIIEQVLLQYTKLWNIFFCDPYQYGKGFVLFHKFSEQYLKLDVKRIGIDLNMCINNTRLILAELLPQVFHSPLTDIDNRSFFYADSLTPFAEKAKVYPVKNKEFHKLLSDDQVFFKDLKNERWISLIDSFCSSSVRSRFIYTDELQRRKGLGIIPGTNEIDEFVSKMGIWNAGNPINRKMLGEVARDNYIFFY